MKHVQLFEQFINEAALPDNIPALEKKLPRVFKIEDFLNAWYNAIERYGNVYNSLIHLIQKFDPKKQVE